MRMYIRVCARAHALMCTCTYIHIGRHGDQRKHTHTYTHFWEIETFNVTFLKFKVPYFGTLFHKLSFPLLK